MQFPSLGATLRHELSGEYHEWHLTTVPMPTSTRLRSVPLFTFALFWTHSTLPEAMELRKRINIYVNIVKKLNSYLEPRQ
jgi:hypothetical protein